MRGRQILPLSDHVARYCSGGTIEDGKPTSGSFGTGSEISVNHLEFFGDDLDDAGQRFREFMWSVNGPLTVRRTGRYAVFHVGRIRFFDLVVVPDPRPRDQSHALIVGPHDDDKMRQLRAALLLAVHSVWPADPNCHKPMPSGPMKPSRRSEGPATGGDPTSDSA